MHLNEYMHDAMSFRLPTAGMEYALLNLPGEVGELLSLEAKLIRDGGNMDTHKDLVKKELGDILWCLTAVAKDYGFTLEDIAKGNIQKLTSRKANNTIQGNGDER
jgi:NTP pyrophosphatase (non-canonical NTP hydrolase)